MSGKLLGWAFDQVTGSWITKLVLVKLADNSNDLGLSYPSVKYLYRHTELSESSVRRALKALEEKGFLKIIPRFHEGVQISNHYQLLFSNPEPPLSAVQDGGCPSDNTPLSGGHTEPLDNPQREPKTPSSKKSSTTDFEQFYQSYPKKEGRRAAEKAYEAARRRGATAEAILSGAARYATGTAGTDRQYVKQPSRWLNGDHWRDGEELAQPVVTDVRDLTAEQWTEELRMFVRYGQWKTANGPSPLFEGCLAPAELLVKAKAFWEQNGNRPVDDVLQAFRKPVEFHPARAVQLRLVGGS